MDTFSAGAVLVVRFLHDLQCCGLLVECDILLLVINNMSVGLDCDVVALDCDPYAFMVQCS